MFVVMGATGHVGGAVLDTLVARGEAVLGLTHDPDKTADLERRGARAEVVDVGDADALREIFRRGRRAYLLNPPGAVSGDFDAEERRTIGAILSALDGSGLEKVVAASTYGAQAGQAIGDLGTLHVFERGLKAQATPAAIVRGAYYFTNWDMMLDRARDEGVLDTVFPTDMPLPMVAPADLGRIGAERLTAPIGDEDTWSVEGPERLSADDVAALFAQALDRPVRAVRTPPERWVETYRTQGFSAQAAESFAGMAGRTVDQPPPPLGAVVRGDTSLKSHIQALVADAKSDG